MEGKQINLQSQIEYIEYSKNVQHSYSKAIGKLFDMAVSYLKYAEKECEAGKNAAYAQAIWESPLFYGCDCIPVATTELGRLGSKQAIAIAENHFLVPKEACSMVESLIGEWYLQRKRPIKKIVGQNSSCEAQNMAFELVKNEGYNVHRLDNVYRPPGCMDGDAKYEQLVGFMTRELEDTARFLLDGKEPDREKIRAELVRCNEAIDKVREIMELRKKKPLYIKSLATMYLLTGLGHYFGRPQEYLDLLDELLEEMKGETNENPEGKEVVPIIWVGGRGQEFGIYHAVDNCGGAIIGWVSDNCYTKKYDTTIDPIEAIARFYLNSQRAGSAEHRKTFINQQLEEANGKGVIFYGYVGCSFGGVEFEMLRNYMKSLDVPSITIEGSFQVGPPSGQLLTRVSAFIEMLT